MNFDTNLLSEGCNLTTSTQTLLRAQAKGFSVPSHFIDLVSLLYHSWSIIHHSLPRVA